MSQKLIPNYLDIFQKRVDQTREKIRQELKKEKSHRDRRLLKELLQDIKGIRKTIKHAQDQHAKTCPNCGHRL